MKSKQRCIKCNKIKPLKDFYIVNSKTGQRRTDCKRCNIISTIKRRRSNPSMVFKHQIKYHYGISVKDYEKLLIKQNYRCAICKKEEEVKHFTGKIKKLGIDHNHKTNKVRGLLCSKCNQGIGYFMDNIKYLQNAIVYLGEH